MFNSQRIQKLSTSLKTSSEKRYEDYVELWWSDMETEVSKAVRAVDGVGKMTVHKLYTNEREWEFEGVGTSRWGSYTFRVAIEAEWSRKLLSVYGDYLLNNTILSSIEKSIDLNKSLKDVGTEISEYFTTLISKSK